MDTKKLAIAGILICSPYIISNYLVFVFFVPVLSLIYSKAKIKDNYIVLWAFLTACFVLLPVIAYDMAVYGFAVIIAVIFVSSFLIISKKLIKWFDNSYSSIFIPCIVWITLLYVLSFKSLAIGLFDVGVLFPLSAPVIWYTGSIGITMLVILFNSTVAQFLVKRDKFSLGITILLLCIFLLSYVFSVTGNPAYLQNSIKIKKVALIQGDVPRASLFGYTEELQDRILRYIGVTDKTKGEHADIIVWPEYTLPVDVMDRFAERMEPIIDKIKNMKTDFIIGSLITDLTKENCHYNAALIFGKDGILKDVYYSQDPAMFNREIRSKDNKGKVYLDNAGITLCWEELNSKIYRDYVSNGAEYFISLSSNTDLDHSWFKKYASFFSRARASENMRYLARSTQTGYTQIIDPFGKILEKIPSNRADFLIGKIYSVSKRTFYSRYGDTVVKLLAAFFIFIMFIGRVKSKRAGICPGLGVRSDLTRLSRIGDGSLSEYRPVPDSNPDLSP